MVSSRQHKSDSLTPLLLRDPKVKHQADILTFLRRTVRRNLPIDPTRRRAWNQIESVSPLYVGYRGIGFPIKEVGGKRIPRWRDLSPWFRCQLYSFVLMECPEECLNFRFHVHSQYLLQVDVGELRNSIRDSMIRHMKRRYGMSPLFFFILEDRDRDGSPTRVHLHGMIRCPRIPVPRTQRGNPTARWTRLISKVGSKRAELLHGHKCVADALCSATGNDGRFPRIYGGVDNSQNRWTKPPDQKLSNDAYVNYLFKHTDKASPDLPDGRLACARILNQEAQRLWRLIREGDAALSQWG